MGGKRDLNQMRKSFQPWQYYIDHWMNLDERSAEFLMWVYQEMSDGTFQVGYFMPTDKTWVVDGTYDTKEKAAARVNYLNGGKSE